MTKTDLLTLADKIEAADEPSRELDAEIARAIGFGCVMQDPQAGGKWVAWEGDRYRSGPWELLKHYTGSIDAALMLGLPDGCCISAMGEVPDDNCWYVQLWWDGELKGRPECRADTLALAITAAALRARAEECE